MKTIKVDIMGYPLKFRDMRPRDKVKADRLVEFYVKTTPPAKDILSGKAFRELFR